MHPEKSISRFEHFYPELRRLLMRQIGRKMPGFTVHHEDLVSTALVDSYEFLFSTMEDLPEGEEAYRELVTRIARQILNRRIADFFRQFGRVVSVDPLDSSLELSVDSENSDLRELLANLLEAAARLSEEEQLLLQATVFTQTSKMNSATRQRLRRLRQKIVADLEEKYGTEIGDLIDGIQSGNSPT